jgi:hypothetical protein
MLSRVLIERAATPGAGEFECPGLGVSVAAELGEELVGIC